MEVKYCALLLIMMATAATVAGEIEELQCVSHNMEPELYKAYQQALEEAFNNTDTLYYLQRAFYPPSSSPPGVVILSVATVVNNIVDSSWPDIYDCSPAFTNDTRDYPHRSPAPPWVRGLFVNDSGYNYCSDCDVLQWSKDTDTGSHLVLVTSINGLLPLLYGFQRSICSILSLGTSEFDVHTADPSTLNLNLTITELSHMPSNYELYEALTSALTWVKGYTKPPHAKTQPADMARGQVTDTADNYSGEAVQGVTNIVITVYVAIYTFTAVFLARFLRKMFSVVNNRVPTYQYAYAAYWGTAFICGWCNLLNTYTLFVNFTGYVYVMSPSPSFVPYGAYTHTFAIIICTFELCLAVYATKGHSFPPPKLLANVFCCCWVFKWSQCHSRIIHTLALVNIAWFVQTILVPGIFVTLFFIILKAAQTIAIMSLVISGLLCAVTFTSFIVYKYSNYERPTTVGKHIYNCLDISLTISGILFVFCIVITALLLYLSLVRQGLSTAGIGGVLVALIPSTVLSLLGIGLKRKLLGGSRSSSSSHPDHQQQQARGPQLGDVAIQIPEDRGEQDENTPLLLASRNIG